MCENCNAINQIEERVDNASHSPPPDNSVGGERIHVQVKYDVVSVR